MNKNVVIGSIIVIVIIGAGWTLYHSPNRTVQEAVPVQQMQPRVPEGMAALVAELESTVQCPACVGESVAECSDSTAAAIKDAIRQLAAAGMNKETVVAHLKMFGYIPDADRLPEGHPPIDAGDEPSAH